MFQKNFKGVYSLEWRPIWKIGQVSAKKDAAMSGESKAKLSQFIQVFFGKHCSESKNKSETNFLIFNIDYILRLKLITVFMFMFNLID